MKVSPGTSGYNDDIYTEKRKRRQLEKKWRKSHLEIHKILWIGPILPTSILKKCSVTVIPIITEKVRKVSCEFDSQIQYLIVCIIMLTMICNWRKFLKNLIHKFNILYCLHFLTIICNWEKFLRNLIPNSICYCLLYLFILVIHGKFIRTGCDTRQQYEILTFRPHTNIFRPSNFLWLHPNKSSGLLVYKYKIQA